MKRPPSSCWRRSARRRARSRGRGRGRASRDARRPGQKKNSSQKNRYCTASTSCVSRCEETWSDERERSTVRASSFWRLRLEVAGRDLIRRERRIVRESSSPERCVSRVRGGTWLPACASSRWKIELIMFVTTCSLINRPLINSTPVRDRAHHASRRPSRRRRAPRRAGSPSPLPPARRAAAPPHPSASAQSARRAETGVVGRRSGGRGRGRERRRRRSWARPGGAWGVEGAS